jgi:hypothetical protein
MSCEQRAGQNHKIITGNNKSFGSAAEFKYLVMMLTNGNCMHEEIKSKLN